MFLIAYYLLLIVSTKIVSKKFLELFSFVFNKKKIVLSYINLKIEKWWIFFIFVFIRVYIMKCINYKNYKIYYKIKLYNTKYIFYKHKI